MRRLLIIALVLVIPMALNIPTVSAQFSEAGVEKLRVAVDAPDLTLKDLDGARISTKELRGKIIVLNFFASYCPNCRRESPSFAKLGEEFKNTDLVLLKVATKEKEQDLMNYKKEFKLSSPILIDGDASSANAYGVWSRPETFFINREGKIVARVFRELDWTSRNTRYLIQHLLKETK